MPVTLGSPPYIFVLTPRIESGVHAVELEVRR